MEPAFRAGDRLLVLRTPRVRPGDVVAVRDPRDPGNVMVKRVRAINDEGQVDVRGDNPTGSTDSRHFGPVDRSDVLGRAVYRYFPGDRVGRLRRE